MRLLTEEVAARVDELVEQFEVQRHGFRPRIFPFASEHADGERRGATTDAGVGISKIWVRHVVRYLWIGAGPEHSPSACSEMSGKKDATLGQHIPCDGAVAEERRHKVVLR